MRTILGGNTTANLLLVLTCGVVLWIAVTGRASTPSPEAAEGVWPSDTAAPVALSALREHPGRSLVLFVNSGCHYCAEEMPFYRELQKLATARGVGVYAVSTEAENDLTTYLHANGLESVTPIAGTSVEELPATPTILVVDDRGLVQGSWRGVLSDRQKAQLRKTW